MSDQSPQDPLEYFQPQILFGTSSSSEEGNVIKSAKKAIDTANREALTPETYAKYQNQLKEVIDTSPNRVMTASYLLKHISEKGFTKTYLDLRGGCVVVKTCGRNRRTTETTGRDSNGSQDKENKSVGLSTEFSSAIKSRGICQITGAPSKRLHSSHILPFSSRQEDNLKTKQYLALVEALFGPDALRRLNGDGDGARNINRLDNGIAMMALSRAMWDAMDFFLEVLWDTYNQSTKEVMYSLPLVFNRFTDYTFFLYSSTRSSTGSLPRDITWSTTGSLHSHTRVLFSITLSPTAISFPSAAETPLPALVLPHHLPVGYRPPLRPL
jgi:hypothetical protein